MNHGVYVSQQATSVSTPVVAESGVPFVVGLAPVQAADKPAAPGTPVLCTSWSEAVEKLGYSDDWATYTLCEFMYSHFKLFACQPVIFCNVLDIATAKEASAAADVAVTEHKVKLPIAAINDSTLVIKPAGGTGSAYVSGTDYNAYYSGEHLVVELLSTGSAYDAEQVNIAYNKVKASTVTASDIASAMENVELCLTLLGIVPDLLCAPGYSQQSTVAAAMTAKAGNINGLFRAKALIDIDCGASGARAYSDVLTKKNAANIADEDEIAFWPMAKLGDYKFHLSTQMAGLMAQIDTGNGGCPYESPSNKGLQCDGLCLEDGTEVNLTLAPGQLPQRHRRGYCAELHERLGGVGQLHRLLSLQHRCQGLLYPGQPYVRLGRQLPRQDLLEQAGQAYDPPPDRHRSRFRQHLAQRSGGYGLPSGRSRGDAGEREPADQPHGRHHQAPCLHDAALSCSGDRLRAGV